MISPNPPQSGKFIETYFNKFAYVRRLVKVFLIKKLFALCIEYNYFLILLYYNFFIFIIRERSLIGINNLKIYFINNWVTTF